MIALLSLPLDLYMPVRVKKDFILAFWVIGVTHLKSGITQKSSVKAILFCVICLSSHTKLIQILQV